MPPKATETTKMNAQRLATLTFVFCLTNGLPPTDEVMRHLGMALATAVMEWYIINGKDYDPTAKPFEEKAIEYAVNKCQEVLILASISEQTGIPMEGWNI